MVEDLVTFKTAKLAKEKGYNIVVTNYYPTDNPLSGELTIKLKQIGLFGNLHPGDIQPDYKEKLFTYAPTQSFLQKWLREVHNIHVNISPLHLTEGWRQQAYNMKKGHYKGASAGFHYKTYEKALEAGLQEGLKLIK